MKYLDLTVEAEKRLYDVFMSFGKSLFNSDIFECDEDSYFNGLEWKRKETSIDNSLNVVLYINYGRIIHNGRCLKDHFYITFYIDEGEECNYIFTVRDKEYNDVLLSLIDNIEKLSTEIIHNGKMNDTKEALNILIKEYNRVTTLKEM